MTNAYDASERNAERNGSRSSPDGVAQECPAWTVSVTVKSKVDYWPTDRLKVWLALRSGTVQPGDKATQMSAKTSPPVEFRGRGPHRYTAKASTEHSSWTVSEETFDVTSKDVAVTLTIEPQKWVAFKVVDAGTKERIDGAKLKVTPGPDGEAKELTSSARAEDRNAELHFLRREGTSVVTELTHGDEVWEIASVTSE